VALLFVKLNGQFTPPCETRPFALQLIASPDNVPAPDPLTAMLPAHVAVNVTFALVAVVGVIVYFRFPHPVAGFDTLIDDHVPANASSEVVGLVGLVGLPVSSLSLSFPPRKGRSHPAEKRDARRHAAANLDFIPFLS
jgi:hypothetical protein